MTHPLAADLDHILLHTESLWAELRGCRIFITGGTGFFGAWLLESFAWINDRLNLKATAVVLTRNEASFRAKMPHLADRADIKFYRGDVRSFDFLSGEFSHIIHAATEASAQLNRENPLLMLDTIVAGTRRTLEFAEHAKTQKFLLASSGAVYGRQPAELTHVGEDYLGAPSAIDLSAPYGEGKRMAELLCQLYGRSTQIQMKIARCFAFVGAYLPLDTHFAIGNFINSGLTGERIIIKGDGTPYRSYLYAADLTIWLWTILFTGRAGEAYNVGSSRDLTIAELATTVAGAFDDRIEIEIVTPPTPGKLAERYVPDVTKAMTDLNLRAYTDLATAINKTKIFHRSLRD